MPFIAEDIVNSETGEVYLEAGEELDMTLDAKTPEGKAALTELLKTADVFFHNVRLAGMERLGFGYDPVFVATGETITFGEMDPDRKHAMSHRAIAFDKLTEFVQSLGLPVLGHLRDTQNYVHLAARGLTVFDVAPGRVEKDLLQWEGICQWLDQ